MRLRHSEHSERHLRRQNIVSLAVALSLTIASLGLHLLRFRAAGALWRDEASGVALSTVRSLPKLWRFLMHDSFPGGFPLALRAWAKLGFGASDVSFRAFGLVVGVALLGAFWIAARAVGKVQPLLALALVGVCGALVCDGDAIRGYGLGGVLIVLSFALLWRYIEQPTRWRFVAATLVATASVQVLYQNAFLVLALCIAGAVVAGRARRASGVLTVVAVGILPALSLSPYAAGIAKAQSWWIVEKSGFSLEQLWGNWLAEVSSEYSFLIWIWVLLVSIAVVGTVLRLTRRSATQRPEHLPSPSLFAVTALVLGVLVFLVFLGIARLPTQPWYFVPLVVLVACCLDVGIQRLVKRAIYSTTALAAVLAIAVVPRAVRDVQYRQTNLDAIAKTLASRAELRDLIVVQPWYCGVTFCRYYRGTTPWVTLPPHPGPADASL